MKIFKLICISLIAFNLPVMALIRNVPSQYSTIQSAINASSHGDTVLVQPGTYLENINFRGKKIVLTSRYYQNNDYSFIQTTIINGSNPQNPDTASCVIMHNSEDSTTVLQGFTLTGGKGTKWQDEHGAGLYREGGGVLTALCSPVIRHNIITGNQAITGGVISTGGGGLRLGDGYPRLYNNLITNNTARYGAGVVLNYTGGDYRNNIIYNNYGSLDYGAGSGMWINGTFPRPITIINNSIVFNTSTSSSPGVYSNAPSAFRNNIVWGNTGGNNVQIFSSSLTVRYCDIQGGFTGAGNINVYPQFDTTNYYLTASSPCVDYGDSSITYNDPPDAVNPSLAKWPARGLLRNDIGAYGGPGSQVIANTVVAIQSEGSLLIAEKFRLLQNYPNPFNPVTTIEYYLPFKSDVQLSIYNITGQKLGTVVNQTQSGGFHTIKWSGNAFSSGVYFYELVAAYGQQVYSEKRKMILIK